MIWSKKKHNLGTIRIRRRFAFFPTDIDDGNDTVAWMVWYYEKSEYGESRYYGEPYAWNIVSKTLLPNETTQKG